MRIALAISDQSRWSHIVLFENNISCFLFRFWWMIRMYACGQCSCAEVFKREKLLFTCLWWTQVNKMRAVDCWLWTEWKLLNRCWCVCARVHPSVWLYVIVNDCYISLSSFFLCSLNNNVHIYCFGVSSQWILDVRTDIVSCNCDSYLILLLIFDIFSPSLSLSTEIS